MRGIATSRAHKDRLRSKYTRLIAQHGLWGGDLTPRRLASAVETHMRPCSCFGCKRGDPSERNPELARLASQSADFSADHPEH